MELKSLISFVAVSERRSFIRAAESLHVSQPAITAQIQRLEEEIGVRLFDRDRRSVRLTQAGATFLEGARATLAQADETVKATQRVARGEAGRVRIGFPPSVLQTILPEITMEFHRQHPHIKLDLSSLHTSVTISALQKGSIDVGYVRMPVAARGLTILEIHTEPLVVCLPEGHRMAGAERVRMKDLADDRFIVYERRLAPGFHDTLVELCLRAGFTPMVAQEIDEMYVVPTLVATGVGIAMLPRMVVAHGAPGTVIVPIEAEGVCSRIGVAMRTTDASPLVHRRKQSKKRQRLRSQPSVKPQRRRSRRSKAVSDGCGL